MRLFYGRKEGDIVKLDASEKSHCIQVLRHRIGDEIHVVDGLSSRYKARIDHIEKDYLEAYILEEEKLRTLPYHLTVAIAPTKNASKIEWFLEKAVEIGIHEIIPMSSARSEKFRIKEDRWNKIILSATKQSMQAILPKLRPLQPLAEVLRGAYDYKFIPYTQEEDSLLIKQDLVEGKKLLVCIGPEGGWTEEEIQQALSLDVVPVSLGHSRLRTETAGVVSCQVIKDIYSLK